MKAPLQALTSEKQNPHSDTLQKAPPGKTIQDIGLTGNRPAAVAQRKLQEMISDSPRIMHLKALKEAIQSKPDMVKQAKHGAMALHQRAVTGTLSTSQVQLRRIEQALSMDGLVQLATGLRSIDRNTTRSIPARLQAGTAALHQQAIELTAPSWGDRSGSALARGVASMQPFDASLSVQQGRYQLKARFNPWIEVAHGHIITVDEVTRHNQAAPGPAWQFASYPTLNAAGVNAHGQALVGQAWPPASQYSVQSATYDPVTMPAAFHALPPDLRPALAPGQAWTHNAGTGQLEIWRNPLVAPASPRTNVTSHMVGARLTYRSHMPDPNPANPASERVLSGYAETAARGATYQGARNYPMTTPDYYDAGGTHWGRGHIVDHADGNAASTSSATDYVPEDRDFNSGARNHEVQALRPTGGAYRAEYLYPPAPIRTNDGTAIPTFENFATYPTGGIPSFYAVDNLNYPADRSRAAITPYQQAAPFAPPPSF